MTAWPYVLSATAGSLTTLSPCVLPILPLVVSASSQRHRLGPVAMAGGMVASFAALGLLLSAQDALSPDIVRAAAAAMMILFGAALTFAPLARRLAAAVSPIAGRADRAMRALPCGGWGAQFISGALLGAVWAPCAGPALGAALSLAAERGGGPQAAGMMAAFGAGAAAPLLAVAYGARELLMRKASSFIDAAERLRRVFGIVLMAAGALVLTGLDKRIDAALVSAMPQWLVDLTTKF